MFVCMHTYDVCVYHTTQKFMRENFDKFDEMIYYLSKIFPLNFTIIENYTVLSNLLKYYLSKFLVAQFVKFSPVKLL